MNTHLERVLREYIAIGSGIPLIDVVPAKPTEEVPRPLDLHASLLLLSRTRQGYPIRRQMPDGNTLDLVYWRADYSLQFYRQGAVDAAMRFDQWAMSENGLTLAETAFTNGHIEAVRVYDGGTGYDNDTAVVFESEHGTGAEGVAVVVNSRVAGVRMTAGGRGYIGEPIIRFTGAGAGARASARGDGFRIRFPLSVSRIDEIIADGYEERVQIDLGIDYATALRQDAGLIETAAGAIRQETGIVATAEGIFRQDTEQTGDRLGC